MITKSTPLTPNVKLLLLERATQLQVEATKKRFGSCGVGEIAAGIAESNGDILKASMHEAFEWTAMVLEVAHRTEGAEEWPTDEDMAGEILRRITERGKKA